MNNCNKKNNQKNNTNKIVETATQYVKDWGVWVFKNEEDLGKNPKEVKEKDYFEFGSKFTVVLSKTINEKDYYKIQLPDKTEYWIDKERLAEKFIVINQDDVTVYTQPDQDYFTGTKLQRGDFGYFIKEQDGWINVNFYAYRPTLDGEEEKKWVGERWIKEGYTDDLMAAREAFYLYWAYFYTYNQKNKNKEKAIEMCQKAMDANAESEIYFVVKDFYNELNKEK